MKPAVVGPRRNAAPALAKLAGIGVMVGWASAAQAATTMLDFAGTVSSFDAALTGTFRVGDPVSIKLVYDPAAADLIAPNPNNAGYPYVSFDLTFGGYSASFGTQFPNSIGVLNNTNQGLGPADAFGASAFQTGVGAPVGGLPLQQGFVSLWDFTQAVFDDTTLPAVPPFSAFSYRVAGLTFCSNPGCGVGSDMSTVFADIGSMRAITTVPEPATVTLVLAGVALLCRCRRRR